MIKLESISKFYYSANAVVPALRKINLEFHTGEFIVITGESGSGKSTLLNIISGLDTYDDGELYVNSEATSDYDSSDWENYRKNKIGFVFQNYNLIEHYSVLNNVESALLIQGYSVKDAKKAARDLIYKVGLSKQLYQKTSKLSSGQKQRLSIARALAKNTDIIIADEPTGNLDSENGKQIMELLSELSGEKLIITVTHNYEEAAPYATRKVRMHEGEVVSDTLMNQSEVVQEDENISDTEAVLRKNNSLQSMNPAIQDDAIEMKAMSSKSNKSEHKIAWRFALMNFTTQPGRGVLFMLFLLLITAVSFLFLGDIYSNWDDTFTKKYDSSYFFNPDKTRIVVKKHDGSNITEEDLEKFNNIKYVKMSDMYDYANDINYFIASGSDYIFNYQSSDNSQLTERTAYFSPQIWTNFMKSSTCIIEEDLSAGTMPKERNEIVIYSEDVSVLGTELPCYFESKNTWNYNEYYTTNVKIVGILEKPTDQVYFSGELCNMLSAAMYTNHYNMNISQNFLTKEFMDNISVIPVIGEDLEYGEIRVSTDLSRVDNLVGPARVNVYLEDGVNSYEASVRSDFHLSTTHFVEFNKDWFYELYQEKSRQASIYIKDYINTDYVLAELKKLGYDAISSYRISSILYDDYKIADRNSIMLRAFIVLLIISVLEILIVRSIMKIRNKDFTVLGSIGMEHNTIRKMNFYEMYLYTSISVIIMILVANVLNLLRIDYMNNMIKYYNLFTYTIYIVLNFAVISITVGLFNRYLKYKQRWN